MKSRPERVRRALLGPPVWERDFGAGREKQRREWVWAVRVDEWIAVGVLLAPRGVSQTD